MYLTRILLIGIEEYSSHVRVSSASLSIEIKLEPANCRKILHSYHILPLCHLLYLVSCLNWTLDDENLRIHPNLRNLVLFWQSLTKQLDPKQFFLQFQIDNS